MGRVSRPRRGQRGDLCPPLPPGSLTEGRAGEPLGTFTYSQPSVLGGNSGFGTQVQQPWKRVGWGRDVVQGAESEALEGRYSP